MRSNTKDILGFLLCLSGIATLLYLIPWLKILILIPIVLFLLSYFIKNRIWSIALNSLTLTPFLIVYLGMRLPTSDAIVFDSEIRYQMIDFGQGDIIRNLFEDRLNNRRIFLTDSAQGIRWIYVDEQDFKKLWPEPPFDMRDKNYTIRARFKTYKLLFCGYSKATIVDYEMVTGNPMITK